MKSQNPLNDVINDPQLRVPAAKESHLFFFHCYFHEYIKYETAQFQKNIFAITEDQSISFAVILAFRGSAKSTIITQSFPIWAIVGKMQKKFVVILSQTQQQAKLHLSNIKREIESNDLLKNDFRIHEEEADEWGSTSLIIPNYNARIICASTEQSIRGIRHGASRPDLIICDDVEDSNSVKTVEGRDKTYTWLTSEVIPCGDINTKIVVIGNLLHQDSLLMRLKEDILNQKRDGVIKEYPIVSEDDKILWPGKYPSLRNIEIEKSKVGDRFSWYREYLLQIIDNQEAVVHKEWIKYYDHLPHGECLEMPLSATVIGVDPAFSDKQTADFTGIVPIKVYGYGTKRLFYVLPNIINKRITSFKEVSDHMELLTQSYGGKFSTKIFVEEVAGQVMIIHELKRQNFIVEGFKVGAVDKRTRLTTAANFIQSGRVLFPSHGAELLVGQILGFGTEKHDDLVDAFTTAILKLIENEREYSPIPSFPNDERFRMLTVGIRDKQF